MKDLKIKIADLVKRYESGEISGDASRFIALQEAHAKALEAVGIKKENDQWWKDIDKFFLRLNPNIEYADKPVPFNAGVWR